MVGRHHQTPSHAPRAALQISNGVILSHNSAGKNGGCVDVTLHIQKVQLQVRTRYAELAGDGTLGPA